MLQNISPSVPTTPIICIHFIVEVCVKENIVISIIINPVEDAIVSELKDIARISRCLRKSTSLVVVIRSFRLFYELCLDHNVQMRQGLRRYNL
jgi:hypothetical protein